MPKNTKNWITIDSSQYVVLRARTNKNFFSLYLDIRYNRKRIYENLHLRLSSTNKRKWNNDDRTVINIARRVMSERNLQIINREYILPDSENNDFLLFFEKFVNDRIERQALDKYKWTGALKHLKNYAGDNRILFKNLDYEFLTGLKNYLLDNLANNTAAGYFAQYNQVLRIALRKRIINYNPMDILEKKITQQQTKREYLTFEEIKLLDKSECPNEATKNAFLFCCFTGLRFSDVGSLTWENIRKNGKNFIMYIKQHKTGEVLSIPLSENALKYLGPRTGRNMKVFTMMSKKRVRKHLLQWQENAGIDKHITFHVSRHTFATLALNFGVDIKVVSKLLGHNEVRTTEIYAKIMDKTKEEAVKKLPKL